MVDQVVMVERAVPGEMSNQKCASHDAAISKSVVRVLLGLVPGMVRDSRPVVITVPTSTSRCWCIASSAEIWAASPTAAALAITAIVAFHRGIAVAIVGSAMSAGTDWDRISLDLSSMGKASRVHAIIG